MNELKISERLTKILADNNLTHKALSDLTGIGRATIGNYCEGTRTPDAYNIAKIAEAVNVSTDYLIGLSDTPSTTSIKTQCDIVDLISEIAEKLNARIFPKEANYPDNEKGRKFEYTICIDFNGNKEIYEYFAATEMAKDYLSGFSEKEIMGRVVRLLKNDLKEKTLTKPV